MKRGKKLRKEKTKKGSIEYI